MHFYKLWNSVVIDIMLHILIKLNFYWTHNIPLKVQHFLWFEILATFCVKKWLWYSAKSTVYQKQQVKIHISTLVSELSCFAIHESIFLKDLLWVF